MIYIELLKLRKQFFSILQKYPLDYSNHIYIWQASLQLTSADTCQI